MHVRHSCIGLEIVWAESRVLSNSRQHARSNFHVVMERKNDVRPAWSPKDTVRTAWLSLNTPSDAQQRGEHSTCFCRRAIDSWSHRENRSDLRNRPAVLQPIGQYAQRQGLYATNGFIPRIPIGKNAGNCRNLRNPAAVVLLFDLDCKWHSLTFLRPLHCICRRSNRQRTLSGGSGSVGVLHDTIENVPR